MDEDGLSTNRIKFAQFQKVIYVQSNSPHEHRRCSIDLNEASGDHLQQGEMQPPFDGRHPIIVLHMSQISPFFSLTFQSPLLHANSDRRVAPLKRPLTEKRKNRGNLLHCRK
jgi:hypothetical protein